jgi:hypothetical protein
MGEISYICVWNPTVENTQFENKEDECGFRHLRIQQLRGNLVRNLGLMANKNQIRRITESRQSRKRQSGTTPRRKKVRKQDAKIKRCYENCQRKVLDCAKSYMDETVAELSISDPKPFFPPFYPSFYSKKNWLNVTNENK